MVGGRVIHSVAGPLCIFIWKLLVLVAVRRQQELLVELVFGVVEEVATTSSKAPKPKGCRMPTGIAGSRIATRKMYAEMQEDDSIYLSALLCSQ